MNDGVIRIASSGTGLAPDRTASGGATADGTPVAQLAQEFEAMLLLQMVRQMRQSLLEEPKEGEGLGIETMTETFDFEFARFLARSGGVGVGRLIQQAVPGGHGAGAPPVGIGTPTGLVGPATRLPALEPPAPAPPVRHGGPSDEAPEEVLSLPLTTAVSSPFGWRRDPLGGGLRFHAGIDLRAAYGREVPSAAQGRVVSAGELGAYGQTVVIEHQGGLRTRYAHLSAITVEVGQELAKGEVLGRVGQSGRTTGPHLHFEVLKDGTTLNPLEVAGAFTDGLKPAAAPVDFPPDRPSTTASSNGADHEG